MCSSGLVLMGWQKVAQIDSARVDVVWRYEDVAGYRMPVETTSLTQLRFPGSARFNMTTRHESNNGAPVGPVTDSTSAAPRRP
jgi:hypothetical protein